MATYCPLNEAFNKENFNNDTFLKHINNEDLESIQTNEISKYKNIEDPHFFQELPFISANGTLINENSSTIQPKKIIKIEPFQTSHCTHLLTCPYCRKILNKYKNSYKTILKIILICVIILLLFDLMN